MIASNVFRKRQQYRGLWGDETAIVFVPHEECKENMPSKTIFETCKKGVDQANIVIAILDGSDADSGTSWETV